MSRSHADVARSYYEALDSGDYVTLVELYAPEVVHHRPDRTFEGRETLVSFMREGRPQTDTTHKIEGVFERVDGGGVAVQGRLLDGSGTALFTFVDVFEFNENEAIRAIYTHTR